MDSRLKYIAISVVVVVIIAASFMIVSNGRSGAIAAERAPLNPSSLFNKSPIDANTPHSVVVTSKVMGKGGMQENADFSKEYLSALSTKSILVNDDVISKLPKLQDLIAGADKLYEYRFMQERTVYITDSSRAQFEPIILSLSNYDKILTQNKIVNNLATNEEINSTEFSFLILYKDTYYQIGAIYPAQ